MGWSEESVGDRKEYRFKRNDAQDIDASHRMEATGPVLKAYSAACVKCRLSLSEKTSLVHIEF
jgi:hypothetical protein